DDDLILPARLRRHHRRLGARDELARVHRVLWPVREPDGDRDPAGGLELEGGERLGDPPGQAAGELVVARREDDAELLAAEPADDVGAAYRAAKRGREAAEHLVARPVAVDVVDALEVVDVEHQDGDRVVRAARSLELLAQAVVEGAAVVEAGQRVGWRLVLETRA